MDLPSPQSSGWVLQTDGRYTVEWKASEVQQRIKRNIEFLTKECSYKKSCKTFSRSCKKRSTNCGPDVYVRVVLMSVYNKQDTHLKMMMRGVVAVVMTEMKPMIPNVSITWKKKLSLMTFILVSAIMALYDLLYYFDNLVYSIALIRDINCQWYTL